MATTNLVSKSLGDVLTESGNGVPDHTSPMGSIYSDKDTGNVWRNTDGSTTWEQLSSVAYGQVYFNDSTTTTTISSSPAWFAADHPAWTTGPSVGFSGNSKNMLLLSGYSGTYEIRADVTLDYTTSADNYEVGISINGADPTAGAYSGTYLDTTYVKSHLSIQTIKTLSDGNTISLDIRNIDAAVNGEITHAQLFVRRIS
jgi:hypothetical protein